MGFNTTTYGHYEVNTTTYVSTTICKQLGEPERLTSAHHAFLHNFIFSSGFSLSSFPSSIPLSPSSPHFPPPYGPTSFQVLNQDLPLSPLQISLFPTPSSATVMFGFSV